MARSITSVTVSSTRVFKIPSKAFRAKLAKDPLVTEWLAAIAAKAGTYRAYMRGLASFCLYTGWSPEEIIALKRKAMKRGEPIGEVEVALRQFYVAVKAAEYADKSSSQIMTACYSFLNSHGFPVPKKLIMISQAVESEIRVLEPKEVEAIIAQAGSLEKATLFTLMAECPARPRVFFELQWSWLEEDWYERDVAHIWLPRHFRPPRGGRTMKFEPICFIGPCGIAMLKKLRDRLIGEGHPPIPNAEIFAFRSHRTAIYNALETARDRAVGLSLLRAQKDGEERLSPKSFRKFVFNIIDSLEGISPEYRAMLKGRDLGVEKYYSKANIEALRKVYREKVYPAIWDSSGGKKPQTREDVLKYLAENLSKITEVLAEHEGADVKLKRESMEKGPGNPKSEA
jgi:integrase